MMTDNETQSLKIETEDEPLVLKRLEIVHQDNIKLQLKKPNIQKSQIH